MSGSCAHAEAETVHSRMALMQALNNPPFALQVVIAPCPSRWSMIFLAVNLVLADDRCPGRRQRLHITGRAFHLLGPRSIGGDPIEFLDRLPDLLDTYGLLPLRPRVR